MNELTSVKDLVLINDNGEMIISGRKLHEFMEIKTPYPKWFQRMCEYGFTENLDFTAVGQKCPIANGGYQEVSDHNMTIDMAKELCMIQRTGKGKEVPVCRDDRNCPTKLKHRKVKR